MKRILVSKRIAIIMSIVVLMSGCGAQKVHEPLTKDGKPVVDISTEAVGKTELLISAATSLKDAMTEVKLTYETAHPEISIVLNFGASGSLLQQIQQGAPVDVFISAATKQMDALGTDGLILEETRKEFLKNALVLIVPVEDTRLTCFDDLKSERLDKLALGEPGSVPAGQYAEEVLKSLQLFEVVSPQVVYAKDVKEVLAWVATANVSAGIVYATDAVVSDQVKIIDKAPVDSHKPIFYPAAVIKDSAHVDEATSFVEYLYSSEAGSIFEKYGFEGVQ